MTEPSPNFSLEGMEDIDLGLEETTGDSFTEEEPVGELSDDFEVDSFEADNFEVDNFGAESFEADSFENEGDFEAGFGDEDLGQLSEDQLSEVDLMEDQILETDLSDADLGTPEGFDELEDFPETIEPVGAQPTDDLEMEDLEMEGLEMTDLPMADLEVPDLGVPDLAMEEMPSDSLDIADFATEAMEDLDLGSPSDSLELDSIEEMQGLEEIEDMELGLNGDFARADVRHLLKDKDDGHHESFKSLRFPDRVGTNYARSDDLSCYKILPKGQMPPV